MAQKAAFATGVPSDIYAFHRYTGSSAFLYHSLVMQYRMRLQVEPVDLTFDLQNRLRALYAQ
jgi:hypothetical protein